MIPIAICGLPFEEETELQALFTAVAAGKYEPFVFSRFANGFELLEHVTKQAGFPLIIMDAGMKGLDGIAAARELRMHDKVCRLIFLSSDAGYAYGAWQVDAVGFCLRPLKKARLQELVARALEDYCRADGKALQLKAAGGLYYIPYRALLYVESSAHRIILHTQSEPEISTYGKLDLLEEYLAGDARFVRIHKSCLVNAQHIVYYGKNSVRLAEGTELVISRKYAAEALQKYQNYRGESVSL